MQTHIPADWFDRYRRQLDDYRLPKEATERHTVATTIGNDGVYLLGRVEQDDAVAEVRSHAALAILRQVWEQQYEIEKGQARWRELKELLPSAARIASPHDGEARYSTKRSVTWVGYKAHLSETCDEHYPRLITHVETTLATTDAIKALPTIHQELAERARLPGSHLVDTAYGSAEMLVESLRRSTASSWSVRCRPTIVGKRTKRRPSPSTSSLLIGRRSEWCVPKGKRASIGVLGGAPVVGRPSKSNFALLTVAAASCARAAPGASLEPVS